MKLSDAPPKDRERFAQLKKQPRFWLIDPTTKPGAPYTKRWIMEQSRWLKQNGIDTPEEFHHLMSHEFEAAPVNPEMIKKAQLLKALASDPTLRSKIKGLAKRLGIPRTTARRMIKEKVFSDALDLLKRNPKLLESDLAVLLDAMHYWAEVGIQNPFRASVAHKRSAGA
jgi:hypothetical protein